MNRTIVLMGVAGSGKTSVGQALAARLDCAFLDADDFHPPANVAKMRAGEPLTDADRRPWLDAIRAGLHQLHANGESAVLACSALKQTYRQQIGDGMANLCYVYLRVDRATARARMRQRTDHFMPPTLIDSQFDALEEPDHALVVDAGGALDDVVEAILAQLPDTT